MYNTMHFITINIHSRSRMSILKNILVSSANNPECLSGEERRRFVLLARAEVPGLRRGASRQAGALHSRDGKSGVSFA